jgi:hypothetical protein
MARSVHFHRREVAMRALTWLAVACGPGEPTATVPSTSTSETDVDTDADLDADLDADADVDTGPVDTYTGTTAECAAITAAWRQDYEATLDEHRDCATFTDCWLPIGACDTRLGACYEAVNLGFLTSDREALEDGYRAALADAGCHVPFGGCAFCSGTWMSVCGEDHRCALEEFQYTARRR